jgi:predicted transcriptional regulator
MLIPNVIKQFLQNIRSTVIPAGDQASEWVSIEKQQTLEHARWLNGAQIESLLGKDLSTAHVILPPNATLNDLTRSLLAQRGRFVAVVDQNQVLLSLVDRQEVLDNIAQELLNQSGPNRS